MTERDLKHSTVIGIQSEMPGYKFCWAVNQALDINFTRQPDFDIPFCIRPAAKHYVHMYMHSSSGHNYMIYKLGDEDKRTFSTSQQFDYLWVVQSMNCETEADNLTAFLKSVPDVKKAEVVSYKRNEEVLQLLVA